jgi:hypothetical protein
MKVALLLALAFVSCQSDLINKEMLCKDLTVSLSDTFHQDGEKFNVVFTTYKVNEPRYNPTRYFINKKKVADSYNVPAVVSLSAKYEKLLDAKPNDTIVVEINGIKAYYLFQDRLKFR